MVNWLQRGLQRLAGLDPGQVTDGWANDRYWGSGQFQSMSGQPVTSESVLQLDVVQSVLERLSGTISTLPLMVFERDGNGGRKPAPEHPLYKILHTTPNARQTAQEYRDDQQRHLAFWRNCYAHILPAADGSPIGSLEPIHPSLVTEVWREGGFSGRVFYRVRDLTGAGSTVYSDDVIFHIRKAPLTPDGLMGVPMYRTGRETFGRAQAVEQYGALYFANGGSGGGTLEHPGQFADKDEQNAFLEAWRSGGTGLNRHSDRLLLNGVKYSPFSVNNNEAQFLETMKECGSKICRLWNMPPHLAGMLDKATFSNIEQQSIEYVVHTLAPWVTAWEQAAGRDLLIGADQDRYFVEFNLAGILRGDLPSRWKAYAQGRQWGWLSVNDIRRMENQEPIGPGGDIYISPLNMSPAGKPLSDGQETAPDPDEPQDPADAPQDGTGGAN